MVGRNLMDHPIQLSWALSGEPVFPQRGPLSTAGIETTRQAATRNQLSAFRVEVGNDGWRFPIGDPTFEFGHEANGTFVQLREGGKALAVPALNPSLGSGWRGDLLQVGVLAADGQL
jgi:hypothetical protein